MVCTASQDVRNGTSPVVFIYHPSGYNNDFMLAPIVLTLEDAINRHATSLPLLHHTKKWTIVSGHCRLNSPWGYLAGGSPQEVFAPVLQLAQAGDIFIWIGERYDPKVAPFPWFSDRGVTTIHYKTENVGTSYYSCKRYPWLDEVWTFSWHGIDTCREKANGTRWRYVPPGAYMYDMPIRGSVNLSATSDLVFFGKVDRSTTRWPCLARIAKQKSMHCTNGATDADESACLRFHTISNAFDESSFKGVMSQYLFFLNLHKTCGLENVQADAVRISKLLAYGGLVVSERSYARDEFEYENTTSFVSIARIGEELARLRSLSAADLARLQAQRVSTFRQRFAPSEIFRRAGIYTDLLTHRKQ